MPLNMDAWEAALASHPDRVYARYLCQGLRKGFCVGFQHGRQLKSATVNMPSTRLQPETISAYIASEQAKGPPLLVGGKKVMHLPGAGVISCM